MSGIGARLKKLRRAAGLTQKELAEPLFTAAYVSTIEAGRRTPSATAAEHFARKLGVETAHLVTGRPPDVLARLHDAFMEGRRMLAAGDAEVAMQIFERSRRRARAYEVPGAEARALYGLGLCAEAANRLDEAVAFFEEAENAFGLEDLAASADALAARCRCLMAAGEVKYAIYLIEKRLDVLRIHDLDDPDVLVRLNASLVGAFFEAGLEDRSLRAAEIALELSPVVEDPERLANMHINVARLLLERGAWEAAERHYIRAEAFFRQLDYRSDLGRVHLARGYGLRMQGVYDRAREHVTTALGIFQETGHTMNEARAHTQLGLIERMASNLDVARVHLRRAAKISKTGEQLVRGVALRELALCDAEIDVDAAIKGVQNALQTLLEAEALKEVAITYRELGDLLLSRSDLQPACDAFRRAAITLEAAA